MRTRPTAWLPFISLVLACGGPAAPATSPDVSPEASEEAKAPEGADATAAKGEGAETEEGARASAPASDEDVTAILQLVVNDPELDNYLHLGEPGRFPLQLAGERLPRGLELSKSTEPVKIVDGPKSKKDAVLVVTEIDVQGNRATVRYRYDIESVRGTVTLAKASHGWELKNSRLVEH